MTTIQTWLSVDALTAHMASVERELRGDGNNEVAKAIQMLREQLQVAYDTSVNERD